MIPTRYPIIKFKNGKVHCANGPAKVWDEGDWHWYLYGKWHRYYGPIDNDGDWWIDNEFIK